MLKGKKIVVGVSGGIAAYKVVDVVSRLKKLEAEVHVIMTEHATEFVTPLTFQSISHNPVTVNMFEKPNMWDIQHISLAQAADFFLVAPATANLIGKIANGICDDMLSTTIIATKAKVLFVPAMNYNMYANPLVQENIKKLTELGYNFMEPGIGPMAEGSSGKGRLPEPEEIVNELTNLLFSSIDYKNDLEGKKILITVGPTLEAIDPVRYISNHSSGKMGFAIAQKAIDRGANVVLISGPVSISFPKSAEVIKVKSAIEMNQAVKDNIKKCDIAIFSAAVADYRPLVVEKQKMKKNNDTLSIELIKNPDIALEAGKNKANRIHVGFAAETENLEINALKKLLQKNLDLLIANDVTEEGAGFLVDTNIVKIFGNDGIRQDLPKMSKLEVADKILDEIKLIALK